MDNHIADLVDKKRYTQAFKVLQNKLKKSPQDAGLLIVKAEIQLASGGGQLQPCRDLCVSLCTRKPPITNHAHVAELYAIICRLSLRSPLLRIFHEALTLWLEAIKNTTRPEQKLSLAQDWISQAIRYEEWAMVAQAALCSQRMAPANSREKKMYYFWYITARFLTSLPSTRCVPDVLTSVGNTPTSIDRGLAIAALKKLVKDAPEERVTGPTDVHGQWISQPSELRLLCRVFQESREFQPILDALHEKKLIEIVKQDYAFAYNEREAITSLAQRTVYWSWGKDTLYNAMERNSPFEYDNWDYWDALLCGLVELMNNEKPEDVDIGSIIIPAFRFISDFKDRATSSRSAQIAYLSFCWELIYQNHLRIHIDGVDRILDKQEIFNEYFRRNATESFVVEDLQRFIGSFSAETYSQLRVKFGNIVENGSDNLTEIQQLSWLTSEVNVLALDFLRLKYDNEAASAQETVPELTVFAKNCLRLYRISRKHTKVLPVKASEPGDMACQLACSALNLCSAKTGDATYLVKMLCLLGFLTGESKYNFEARINFVEVALQLGLPPTAWQAYKELDVKKILHESLAPTMFNRISLLYPFASRSQQFDPYTLMKLPLLFYEKTLAEIPDYQELALQHENYVSVVGMKEFADQLHSSPTRTMLIYERRRIARLTGKQYDPDDTLFDENNFPCPNAIEKSKASPLALRFNRLWSDDYLHWLFTLDAAFDFAAGQYPWEERQMKNEFAAKCYYLWRTKDETGHPRSLSLSKLEKTVLLAGGTMINIAEEMERISTDYELLCQYLQTLLESLGETVADAVESYKYQRKIVFFPPAQWYNEALLSLEFYQVVFKLAKCILVLIKQKNPSEPTAKEAIRLIQTLQFKTNFLAKAVYNEATAYSKKIKTAVQDGSFVKLATGIELSSASSEEVGDGLEAEILRVMGYERIKTMVLLWTSSAQSALEGVLNVKID